LASFVFPLELLAAIFGFLARDSFAATGLGLFATSWLALGIEFASAPVPGVRNAALGIYLLAFAAAVGALAVAAFAGKPLIGVIMLAATGRVILAGIYQLGGSHGLLHAAGIIAIVIAGLAWYGGVAFLIEDVKQRTVLPTFRRGGSKATLEGSLREQIERATGDAGVRQQL
jgi:succinate-acetate transporter protein